jgi:hypothetical protein
MQITPGACRAGPHLLPGRSKQAAGQQVQRHYTTLALGCGRMQLSNQGAGLLGPKSHLHKQGHSPAADCAGA